jgi:hypothetical protein
MATRLMNISEYVEAARAVVAKWGKPPVEFALRDTGKVANSSCDNLDELAEALRVMLGKGATEIHVWCHGLVLVERTGCTAL